MAHRCFDTSLGIGENFKAGDRETDRVTHEKLVKVSIARRTEEKGIRPASISSGSEKRVTKNPTISRPRGSRAGDRRRPRIHPRTILRNRDGLRTRASRAYEVPNPGSRTSSILVVIFRSTIGFPQIAPGPP
jgi:hypothetical protein